MKFLNGKKIFLIIKNVSVVKCEINNWFNKIESFIVNKNKTQQLPK